MRQDGGADFTVVQSAACYRGTDVRGVQEKVLEELGSRQAFVDADAGRVQCQCLHWD